MTVLGFLINYTKAKQSEEEFLAELDAQFSAYYDILTEEEIAEDRAWGEFSLRQLVLTDE